jgi:hypothetical protein
MASTARAWAVVSIICIATAIALIALKFDDLHVNTDVSASIGNGLPAVPSASSAVQSSGGNPVEEVRSQSLVRLQVVDGHEVPVPNAMLVEYSSGMRIVSRAAAVAVATDSGIIEIERSAVPTGVKLLVACEGYESYGIGSSTGITDGMRVVLNKLVVAEVFVHEFGAPLAGAVVSVSSRDFGHDEVPPSDSQAVIGCGGISSCRTNMHGIARVALAEDSQYLWCVLPGYLLTDGCPLVLKSNTIPAKLEMRRVVGCVARVDNDEVLSFQGRIPSTFVLGQAHAALLNAKAREVRRQDKSSVAFLGVAAANYLDASEVMRVDLLTRDHGFVTADLPVKYIKSLDGLIEADVVKLPRVTAERQSDVGTVSFFASLNGGKLSRPPDLQLTSISDGVASARPFATSINIDWSRPLKVPVGRYQVGHRVFRAIGECVSPESRTVDVVSGVADPCEIKLSYEPSPVKLELAFDDGLRVRGGVVRFEATPSVVPGVKPIVHSLPDVWKALVWLPPGDWTMSVQPFDARGAMVRRQVSIANERQADAVVVQ